MLTNDIQGSYIFLDVNWPSGFGDEFMKTVEEISRGEDISDALKSLNTVWNGRVMGNDRE